MFEVWGVEFGMRGFGVQVWGLGVWGSGLGVGV